VNGIDRETMTSDREAHAYAHFSRQATGQCFGLLRLMVCGYLGLSSAGVFYQQTIVALPSKIIKQERSATACLP